MDMFQSDLKNYSVLLKNNREKYSSKKNEKKEIELEILNTKFGKEALLITRSSF